MSTTRTLPVIPLRGMVFFPGMVAPLFVGRPRSTAALQTARRDHDGQVILLAQINARENEPGVADLYDVGCLARVDRIAQMPDESVKVTVEGICRVQLQSLDEGDDHLVANVIELQPSTDESLEAELAALVKRVRQAFEQFAEMSRRIPVQKIAHLLSIEDPSQFCDMVAANIGLKVGERQQILAKVELLPRLIRLVELIEAELEVAQVEQRIRGTGRRRSEVTAETVTTNAQGEDVDEFKNEMAELARAIETKSLPQEAKERLEREFRKLKMMNPMSAEAGVVRTYIDWVLSLPWGEFSEDKLDIKAAQKILDDEHYGLEKAKERILEYLAVQRLTKGQGKGPIMCLVGPPGVGKTSLAKSVAHSTGRKFVRISLGGVRDEAEIRGHRRTYVGALPGKIIHALKKSGTSNPVILLDEIDKMSMDFRGDPSSALLEVLDPEQNEAFVDHYIDLDYDLSKVLFLATANFLQAIPIPLKDRLEIIELDGYTELDKLQIAQQYLVPRQLRDNGLADLKMTLTEEALTTLIRSYTREAGVRSLERQIGAICRKTAREILSTKRKRKRIKIDAKRAKKLLGVERFTDKPSEQEDRVGIVNGLAVTAVGGDLLHVEVAALPGKGKLTFTGKLGDVMQESVQAAMSYVRARAAALDLDRTFYEQVDVHVHFPEGAVPKDGPSAGIAICTGLVSALTRFAVRADVAMTGEVTLRGRVLAIGGLKQKVIAAHRAGIRTVIVPQDNQRHVDDIPDEVRKDIELVFVEHVDDVLRHALRLDSPEDFLKQPMTFSRDYLGIYAH
ncbi:MAG TPA: endopeptidase La [Myxococcales bacterium]|nr:endopeptidase La [Myxococcales bacterium]HAN32226.1 endopeptidase La [Myxococcales bacterium]